MGVQHLLHLRDALLGRDCDGGLKRFGVAVENLLAGDLELGTDELWVLNLAFASLYRQWILGHLDAVNLAEDGVLDYKRFDRV